MEIYKKRKFFHQQTKYQLNKDFQMHLVLKYQLGKVHPISER